MKEVWKDVVEYEGHYQVSNLGNVKSIKFNRNNLMKFGLDKNGYYRIGLRLNNTRKFYFVHRLVAQAFIPNYDNLPQTNHINGIKTDNSIENLEWCTVSHNIKHAFNTGLNISSKGEKHGQSKLTDEQIIEIRNLKDKMLGNEIAKKFNISESRISEIINHKAWKHI